MSAEVGIPKTLSEGPKGHNYFHKKSHDYDICLFQHITVGSDDANAISVKTTGALKQTKAAAANSTSSPCITTPQVKNKASILKNVHNEAI